MILLRLQLRCKLALVVFCILAKTLWPQDTGSLAQLPNGRLLGEVPGHPHPFNNLPTAAAVSPDDRFVVFLHSGYGSYASAGYQSLSVLDLKTDELIDFPDTRLGPKARQTFFLGLAFSLDGRHLFASIASISDPLGKETGSTGNGIVVYRFEEGRISPERFLSLPPRAQVPRGKLRRQEFQDVTYPAGLSVGRSGGEERLLVACNLSDEAVLLSTGTGKVVHRFDLSTFPRIPASMPYTTVMSADGRHGFVSLWNASTVAELDLLAGKIIRFIPLGKPQVATAGGSHPTALLLDRANQRLFVALTNRDQVAVLDAHTGKTLYVFSTKLPGQTYGGSDPESLALSADEKTLFCATAISDSVAVFDLGAERPQGLTAAKGFIPTEWYPTVVVATSQDLLIATAKGHGSGPNPKPIGGKRDGQPEYSYVLSLLRGSLARVPLAEVSAKLTAHTAEAVQRNAERGNSDHIPFAAGESKIRHVIYIIKENRTYDQIFGDLGVGDSEPKLTMFGANITPNQHALAKQFGVLDNFYVSGDVSGDGHVWSTSASVSDYISKTIPVGYRGSERTYDSEGEMLGGIPAEDELPDAGEPTGGYLWKNFASHGISYRHYGEYIVSRWCRMAPKKDKPQSGPPRLSVTSCARSLIRKGEPLEQNVGDPRGGPSPYPWDIPVLAKNIASEPELRGQFDPLFPDFEPLYPDQLRADEFLNEFNAYVASRTAGRDTMPQFILLRLPNDHTAGGSPGRPTPAASVADNDLAVGRVVDAVSHSLYWDDTALLILEDDAQDGPDHVDCHRSIALVISKYSPLSQQRGNIAIPFVEHTFYTTINMVRTIEALLGVPPMNSNDSTAASIARLFIGPGLQPPFHADYRNRDNGLIFQMNTHEWKEGAKLDFSRADAADTTILNQFLWKDRMANMPMPASQHNVFPVDPEAHTSGKTKGAD